MVTEAPEISVLLPTMQPWPDAARSLQSLLEQENPPTFEILLLDGSGGARPDEPHDPRVRWIRLPRKDTFALRLAGIRAARGHVVAITEDHCVADRRWLATIFNSLRDRRRTALLGATANHPETTRTAFDRANFVLTFAAQNTHRLDLRIRALPVPTNLSFVRDGVDAALLAEGQLEYELLADWQRRGAVVAEPGALLYHRQSWGSSTLRVHFASGRSFGASVAAAPAADRRHWWLRLPLLAFRLFRLVVPDLWRGAGGRAVTAADAACVALLVGANVSGQVVGALLGPGSSRRML